MHDSVPAPAIRRRKRRARDTQLVLLAWCLWLILSWLITLTTQTIQIAASVIMPFSSMIGLTICWPMLRLSQGTPAMVAQVPHRSLCHQTDVQATCQQMHHGPNPTQAGTALLVEWLHLNVIFQAVVWPLMLNAQWTVHQTAWVDATVASWSLLAALITALGQRTGTGWSRTVAMAVCTLILLGEPALLGLSNLLAERGGGLAWPMRISPIQAMWDMIRTNGGGSGPQYGPQVIAVGAAAAAGWSLLVLNGRSQARI